MLSSNRKAARQRMARQLNTCSLNIDEYGLQGEMKQKIPRPVITGLTALKKSKCVANKFARIRAMVYMIKIAKRSYLGFTFTRPF